MSTSGARFGTTFFAGVLLLLDALSPALAQPFVDVTAQSGIDFTHVHGGSGKRYLPETMGAGGAVLDFDRDGNYDLFLVQSGPLPGFRGKHSGNRLYRNLGDGTFQDVSAKSGLNSFSGYGQGAVAADYDRDGWVDLYLTSLHGNHLYRNLGKGRFADVTAAAGVASSGWGSSAVFFDADGDADLDLLVVNYVQFKVAGHRDCTQQNTGITFYCHPDVYPADHARLFRNLGNGRFRDDTEASGITGLGNGLGAIAVDFDQDGDFDVYVANDSTPNFLYTNDGKGQFSEQALLLGAALNEDGKAEAGMGVDAGDVNNDGWQDLIVTNLSLEANALYFGGPQGFRYGTREAGIYASSFPVLGFGVGLADFDLDRDLDLLVVNGDVQDNISKINDGLTYHQPAHLFQNDGTGKLTLLTAPKTGDLARPAVGRSALLLDFDNDGDLDTLVTHNNGPARLYRNDQKRGKWIGLDLQWCRGPATGAKVVLEDDQGRQFREIRAGSGYQSSSDPRLLFGLGQAQTPTAKIVWPDGSRQVLAQLPINAYYPKRNCLAKH